MTVQPCRHARRYAPWPSGSRAERQVLCIVNTRRHARELYEAIRDEDGAFHLTTLMCAAHRREVLAAIRERLQGRPTGAPRRDLADRGRRRHLVPAGAARRGRARPDRPGRRPLQPRGRAARARAGRDLRERRHKPAARDRAARGRRPRGAAAPSATSRWATRRSRASSARSTCSRARRRWTRQQVLERSPRAPRASTSPSPPSPSSSA